jgi:hypothetical protein
VQDRRPLQAAEHDAVDLAVVVRAGRERGQRAARHYDRLRSRGLDDLALLLVGRAHVGDAARLRVIRPGPGGDAPGGGLGRGPLDQLARDRPVQPHASLRGVHRLGHAEPARPQVAAERERRLPVDRSRLAERVGDHVRGRERHARDGR